MRTTVHYSATAPMHRYAAASRRVAVLLPTQLFPATAHIH